MAQTREKWGKLRSSVSVWNKGPDIFFQVFPKIIQPAFCKNLEIEEEFAKHSTNLTSTISIPWQCVGPTEEFKISTLNSRQNPPTMAILAPVGVGQQAIPDNPSTLVLLFIPVPAMCNFSFVQISVVLLQNRPATTNPIQRRRAVSLRTYEIIIMVIWH